MIPRRSPRFPRRDAHLAVGIAGVAAHGSSLREGILNARKVVGRNVQPVPGLVTACGVKVRPECFIRAYNSKPAKVKLAL